MDSLAILPGFRGWSPLLETLVAHPGPLFIHGDTGCGVTTLTAWLAQQRSVSALDDADRLSAGAVLTWLAGQPRGVLGAHRSPADPELAEAGSHCLVFRLPSLEEDPACMPGCLQALARAEGLVEPWPASLAALPCPGNLRGLRNRVLRFHLLGQLPEDPLTPQAGSGLPLEAEDIASNLHALERILVHRALRRSYGNRVEAARRLGVSRRQLYLLIARHGDPVRGEPACNEGPQRLRKRCDQNSRIPPSLR